MKNLCDINRKTVFDAVLVGIIVPGLLSLFVWGDFGTTVAIWSGYVFFMAALFVKVLKVDELVTYVLLVQAMLVFAMFVAVASMLALGIILAAL